MSNYDMIHENQVEILELSDEAMESVAGGGFTVDLSKATIGVLAFIEKVDIYNNDIEIEFFEKEFEKPK